MVAAYLRRQPPSRVPSGMSISPSGTARASASRRRIPVRGLRITCVSSRRRRRAPFPQSQRAFVSSIRSAGAAQPARLGPRPKVWSSNGICLLGDAGRPARARLYFGRGSSRFYVLRQNHGFLGSRIARFSYEFAGGNVWWRRLPADLRVPREIRLAAPAWGRPNHPFHTQPECAGRPRWHGRRSTASHLLPMPALRSSANRRPSRHARQEEQAPLLKRWFSFLPFRKWPPAPGDCQIARESFLDQGPQRLVLRLYPAELRGPLRASARNRSAHRPRGGRKVTAEARRQHHTGSCPDLVCRRRFSLDALREPRHSLCCGPDFPRTRISTKFAIPSGASAVVASTKSSAYRPAGEMSSACPLLKKT